MWCQVRQSLRGKKLFPCPVVNIATLTEHLGQPDDVYRKQRARTRKAQRPVDDVLPPGQFPPQPGYVQCHYVRPVVHRSNILKASGRIPTKHSATACQLRPCTTICSQAVVTIRPPAVFLVDHLFRSPLFSSADVRARHPLLESAEDLRDLKRRASLRAVFAVAM